MVMIVLAVQSIALVFGSLLAGVALCALLWMLFRLVGHPAWGPPLVILLIPITLLGWLPRSEFLSFTLIFAVVAALPFWAEGRAWWKRHASAPSLRARGQDARSEKR
jgi:hypothetical protein